MSLGSCASRPVHLGQGVRSLTLTGYGKERLHLCALLLQHGGGGRRDLRAHRPNRREVVVLVAKDADQLPSLVGDLLEGGGERQRDTEVRGDAHGDSQLRTGVDGVCVLGTEREDSGPAADLAGDLEFRRTGAVVVGGGRMRGRIGGVHEEPPWDCAHVGFVGAGPGLRPRDRRWVKRAASCVTRAVGDGVR
ncbi:hypothetical protein AB0D27_33650 [Streptomyces sp. NPDC048415]|uniref:hypothetical protein n=1 Tax=Streptomyces sp. NPDC048415 TaxID=3154822 RepID=UPI003418B3E5